MTFDTLPTAPVFPPGPLDVRTELNLSGTWTDITAYVHQDPVTITRGHPDESTTTTASTAALTLNNSDGRFSATNPAGPYYGSLIRNTPVRVSVPEGAAYWRSETDQASYVSAPFSAGWPAGAVDTEWQIDVTLDNWNGPTQTLASLWNSAAVSRWWFIAVTEQGNLQLVWTTDGTMGTVQFAQSTLPIPLPPLLRLCLRVTFAHATGTITFYTAPAGNLAAASWTQLGAAVVIGATSLPSGLAGIPLNVGWNSGDADFFNPGVYGKVHAFRWLAGIAGTEKAGPDFTAQTAGTTSFADAEANTWTLTGTGEISTRKYRFHGEVPAWPQASTPAGTDVKVAVTCAGLLRRTGRAQQPLNSPLYRGLVRLAGSLAPVAYWPCEDASGSAQLASAISGPAMSIAGPLTLASVSGFACSAPIPVLNGAVITGKVPAYASGNDIVLRFLMAVPAGGDTNGGILATLNCTGTVTKLTLTYGTGGLLTLTGYSSTGAVLFTNGPITFAVNGELLYLQVYLQKSLTSINYGMQTLQPGAIAGLASSGTLASSTVGTVTSVTFNTGGLLTATAIGHVSLQSTWDSLFDVSGPLSGWAGSVKQVGALSEFVAETAGNRFERLCGEEGIAFRGRGNLDDTVAMGAQTLETLTSLLQECADADRGIWTEPRQVLGWEYRTRVAVGNQVPAVVLDYTQDHLEMPLEPTEDDQIIQNDVTVSNTDGSSSRQVQNTGALSIQPPPAGVGRYDTSVSVNLATDGMLDSEAAWILHFGTVAEPRYPAINIDLGNTSLASLYYQILDADLGDRVQVVNTPVWLPPGGIDQIINGVTETLFTHELTEAWAGVPASPWNVAYSDDPVYGRADTDGSVLHANCGSSGGFGVDTTGYPNSPLWTTAAGDFPFDIIMGGERITVSAISAGPTPQNFTVTRSVNGVHKSHLAGEDVRLYVPPIVSL